MVVHYWRYKDDIIDGAETTAFKAKVTCRQCLSLMAQDELQEHERKEDTMKTFYMVMIENRAAPSKQHASYLEAYNEAERLLLLPDNFGRSAIILKSVSYGRLEDRPIHWENMSS